MHLEPGMELANASHEQGSPLKKRYPTRSSAPPSSPARVRYSTNPTLANHFLNNTCWEFQNMVAMRVETPALRGHPFFSGHCQDPLPKMDISPEHRTKLTSPRLQ